MHSILSKIIIICGPTASGKSSLALELAHILDAEIVNADSMQVYRRLDIGTAKPSRDQQSEIRHHLIDIIEPDQLFSAADFAAAADAAIRDIVGRGKRVIVVGGTGLYIRALIHGLVDSPGGKGELRQMLQDVAADVGNLAMLEKLRCVDPELAATLHPNNLVRIIRGLEVHRLTGIPLSRYQQEHSFAGRRYDALQIGISVDRASLYERIEGRVDQMLAAGLMAEVRGLVAAGFDRNLKSMRSIGYKETAACLFGEVSAEEACRLIKRNTRHYAKRQLTWFRADPDILWFEYPDNSGTIAEYAIEFYEQGER
ncbi:MAG: tRNA (adenosine(37)-N6)-dimethylallyltransferase MiaA [Desulfuromonadaceae bacterium]